MVLGESADPAQDDPEREGGVERRKRSGRVSGPGLTKGGGLRQGVTGWRSK